MCIRDRFRSNYGYPAEYVARFSDWIRDALQAGDLPALLAYRRNATEAERAHPSEEHLLPLFLALGAAGEHYAVDVLEGGVADGVLAMDSYMFKSPTATQEITQA